MKTMQKHSRLLLIAAGLLLLSIILLLAIVPGAYTKTLPDTHNTSALIAVSVAIVIRLVLLFGYVLILKSIRKNKDVQGGGYILIGVLLLTFGLIDTDSAFAFLDHKNILYISLLMFASIFCDLTAAVLTFIAVSLKPTIKREQSDSGKKLLNGLLTGVGIIVMLFFAFPWGIILSLVFWIYMGLNVRKQHSFFRPDLEVNLAGKLRKRLKGLLSVAIISFPLAVFGIVMHNVQSAQTGTEESFYFFVGIIAEYCFVLASAGGILTFLKGRQKSE